MCLSLEIGLCYVKTAYALHGKSLFTLSTRFSALSFILKLSPCLVFPFLFSLSVSLCLYVFLSLFSLSFCLWLFFSLFSLSLLSCYAKHLMCCHMFRHLKDFNMKNFFRKFLNDNGNVYTVYVCVCACVCE